MAILKRTKAAKDAEEKVEKVEEAKKEVKKTSKKAAPKKSKAEKKPAAKKETKTPAAKSKKASGDAYRVLVRPMITEKSAQLASENVYMFEVAPDAGKIEVRDAVKALYGVTPRRVNIMNVKGKRVRFGRRQGKRKDWRKAFVYLKKGQHIDVYEGV